MRSVKHSKQLGIGLVEVMVSIAIGLFILAGVLQLYATTSTNSVIVDGSSRIQENARYILARLEADIKQAGYAGCFNMKSMYRTQYFSDASSDYINVEPRYDMLVTTDASAGDTNDFSQFIDGENDQAVGGLSFDTLTVRFFSARNRYPVTGISVSRGTGGTSSSSSTTTLTTSDVSSFREGGIAALGDCSRITIFEVSNEPTSNIQFSGEPGRDYRISSLGGGVERSVAYVYGGDVGVAKYEIGTSAAAAVAGSGASCDSDTPQYCALLRNGDELVEGVEEFEVEYGWQDSAGNLYFNHAAAMTDARWFLTDRVRVSFTLNSVDRSPTLDGGERLTRNYSRTFLIQNQLPGDAAPVVAGGA